ncbi:EVE domain-containing protein [Catenovulum sp. SX2]|uniref:EVE domain-containing protein n=1 Tax=Catenovulum sp. SX2 TaxID=3398614 RepID=UPI003F84165D
MNYWLFKTEPDVFGIDHLQSRLNKTEMWDGVRNYQARNFLRDQVKKGDLLFIYHSSCKNIGIAGLAEVVREAYPDPTQFDPESKYYDPKSTAENPRWIAVDIKFKQKFNKVLSLQEIKKMPQIIELGLVKKGHRLSIMPVVLAEWQLLLTSAQN